MPGISRRDMARYSWEQAGHPLIGTDNVYLALALLSFAVMKAKLLVLSPQRYRML